MLEDPQRRALVVADGDVPVDAAALAAGDRLIVAADGGALKADALGLVPHVVVGDVDSLAPDRIGELAGRGVVIQRHPQAKDASDTELALHEALRRGATEIAIVGALGGHRFEHSLANVLLLTLPELDGSDVRIVDAGTTLRALRGPAELELDGQPGDLVSLLPLSDEVAGVRTDGLEYPLRDESLRRGPSRGLSNVMLGERASVRVASGSLVVVHTRGSTPPASEVASDA